MLLLLLACAPPLLTADVASESGGVTIHANLPLDRIEVVDGTGAPVVRRLVSPPSPSVVVRAPLDPGPHSVRLTAGEQVRELSLSVADRGAATVWIEAPLGQGPSAGEVLLPDGAPVRAGVFVEAHQAVVVRVGLGEVDTLGAGERRVFPLDVGLGGLHTWLEVNGRRQALDLDARSVAAAVLREALVPGMPVLPARGNGSVDTTLPASRITLAAPWWDALLDAWGLGFRARDDLAPRTFVGWPLANPTDQAVHAVVTARVMVDGEPHPAFRPRTRDATHLTEVRRLVRVPPRGSATVSLPIYLDRTLVPEALLARVKLDVQPFGAASVLHSRSVELAVERGSAWATAFFVLGTWSAVAGLALAARRFRSWVDGPSRHLTTVAVFGALSFVVGTASQVVGLGLASVLGPFAPFLLGIVDDAVRVCLLATLLSLVPRAGVVSLALLIGWLMRAVALGAAHPVDALYLGASMLWFEGAIAASGLTRGATLSVGRLAIALALPNAILTAFGLAVSVMVYRLFYADWYVVALVVGPGLLYPLFGCRLAVPFAASLRRVAP